MKKQKNIDQIVINRINDYIENPKTLIFEKDKIINTYIGIKYKDMIPYQLNEFKKDGKNVPINIDGPIKYITDQIYNECVKFKKVTGIKYHKEQDIMLWKVKANYQFIHMFIICVGFNEKQDEESSYEIKGKITKGPMNLNLEDTICNRIELIKNIFKSPIEKNSARFVEYINDTVWVSISIDKNCEKEKDEIINKALFFKKLCETEKNGQIQKQD